MTDKELKKLKRTELMELLLIQGRELDKQKEELDSLREQLDSRQLKAEKVGSIAEAALQVNEVFEAAQAAADQYLKSFDGMDQRIQVVEERCREMEAASKRKCEELEELTRSRCREQEQKSREQCDEMEKQARWKSEAMMKNAEERAAQYWAIVEKKLQAYIQEHNELQRLVKNYYEGSGGNGPEEGTRVNET